MTMILHLHIVHRAKFRINQKIVIVLAALVMPLYQVQDSQN